MSDSITDITLLLRTSALGDPRDGERLMVAIYDDLKRIAASQLQHERAQHTLTPTALVHEAYIRLVNQRTTDWNDRLHFFSIAARIIRRILVDHARERNALKRGGSDRCVSIEHFDPAAPVRDLDLVALDEALDDLEALSERQARVVELRYFGGMTVPEVAAAMGIGERSVDREWQVARAWLLHRLSNCDKENANVDRE
jgi:RNA polymerase sigma factor (TIGR02999 family)